MPDSVDASTTTSSTGRASPNSTYSTPGWDSTGSRSTSGPPRHSDAAADMNPFNRDARLNLTQTYFSAEDWEDLIPAAREPSGNGSPERHGLDLHDQGLFGAGAGLRRPTPTFREYQAIGYEIEDIMLDGVPGGGAKITGQLKNNTG